MRDRSRHHRHRRLEDRGLSRLSRPALLAALLCLAGPGVLPGPAPLHAQTLIDGTEDLDFDRPESWAMKYYGSVSLLTGLGAPQELAPGEVLVGLEGSWLPTLSEEERRVGFFGSKEEDLNRTAVFGRGRLLVGLPGSFVLTAGYTPPVEIDGVEPHLLAVGLGRTLWSRGRWRLGATLHGGLGRFEGDVTCSRDDVAAGDDPQGNPFGCLEPSHDEMEVRYGGLEVTNRLELRRAVPYLSLLVHRFDSEFQVDARYRSVVDRTLLRTDGWAWGATAGLAWRASERVRLGAEAFYSPLEVFRGPGERTQTDALFHARALVTYRVRTPSPEPASPSTPGVTP